MASQVRCWLSRSVAVHSTWQTTRMAVRGFCDALYSISSLQHPCTGRRQTPIGLPRGGRRTSQHRSPSRCQRSCQDQRQSYWCLRRSLLVGRRPRASVGRLVDPRGSRELRHCARHLQRLRLSLGRRHRGELLLRHCGRDRTLADSYREHVGLLLRANVNTVSSGGLTGARRRKMRHCRLCRGRRYKDLSWRSALLPRRR